MNPSNTFKKEDETVNILFCGDHRAEDGVLIVALSLLHHVKEPLNIYVLTMKTATETREYEPFSKKAADLLTQQLQSYNPQNTLHLIDCTELFNESQPSANMNSRFTPYSMLRLYIDLIPDMPDRLLYLDNDVICREPFDDFYYQDLTGVQVVGVLDHYGKWFFHHQMRMADYINSGILLLNLPEIKATNLFVKARRMIATRHMFMPDQAAINRLSHAKKIAPRRFNDQRRLHHDTVFQHFTTSFRFFPWFHILTVKPWQISNVHKDLRLHEYDGLLEEYQQLKSEL